jgi:GH15 family glucan-1,4-alpha-glucosidase
VPDAFPPIESYAFLSDGRAMALVAPSGSVEWLCLPRADDPSVFGALLDRAAGRFRVGPVRGPGAEPPHATERSYLPGSLVLESSWATPTGRLEVRDGLPTDAELRPLDRLVRLARCTGGSVDIELDCEAGFDYGRRAGVWSVAAPASAPEPWVAHSIDPASGLRLELWADLALQVVDGRVVGRRTLEAGDGCAVVLVWGAQGPTPSTVEPGSMLGVTADAWSSWLLRGRFPDHAWRPLLERSALTLKGLIHAPTGAPLAAATTSLPEHVGGGRNWDYRYTWLRDGAFTLAALQDLGFTEEARRFIDFLAERTAGGRELLIMYGIGGERELPESTLDHLTGYRGSRPVRIGNAAIGQRQHDVWGCLLHLVCREVERAGRVDDATWSLVVPQVEAAARAWRQPDRGVWEVRGEPRHFTSSKVMAWVALDRGARLAGLVGDPARAAAWRAEADAIRADVLALGVDARGALTQTYGSDALDASALLAVLMGFLAPDDPHARATVLAVADELTDDGLVLRYRPQATDDGLGSEEGSFTICSFWLVSALARIGEASRARALMERLIGYASPLGLYAEEIDPRTGAHLGNMPQAFSHLALIGAALDLLTAG